MLRHLLDRRAELREDERDPAADRLGAVQDRLLGDPDDIPAGGGDELRDRGAEQVHLQESSARVLHADHGLAVLVGRDLHRRGGGRGPPAEAPENFCGCGRRGVH